MSVILDGTNGVTFPSTTVQGDASIGYGQTWQNVTASRSASTTYTNSTGKPIMVYVQGNGGGGLQVSLTVNGVALPVLSGATSLTASAIVPNGQTYSFSYNGSSIPIWTELR